jgi:hypothetical protein
MKKEKEKLRKEAESDLNFYLRYYQELTVRSPEMKRVVDKEIDRLLEKLKEIGK